MTRAYVGLGANLGEPARALRAALAALAGMESTTVSAVSRFYRSPPWGNPDQPWFVNAVAALETGLAPGPLLAALHGIERAAGRDRLLETARWGPRVLDLDLLLHGDADIDEPGLQLPHPRLRERAFVLLPLRDVAPALVFADGTTLCSLVDGVATGHVEALPSFDPATQSPLDTAR